jgi:hypothetical protein
MCSVDSLHHGPHGEPDQHEDTRTRTLPLNQTTVYGAMFDANVECLHNLKNIFVATHVDLENSRQETERCQTSSTITSQAFLTHSHCHVATVRIIERNFKTLETTLRVKEAEFTGEIIALKTDIHALEADNLALHTKVDALTADNLALHTKVDALNTKVDALTADNLALKADNLALKADNLALNTKVDALFDMVLKMR